MLKTLLKIVSLFKENKIEYCVIGGLAMLLHNGRANTVDIDFYVLVNDLDQVKKLFEKMEYSVRTAGEYQLKAKVDSVPIDILFADQYVGEDVVHRAVERKLGDTFVRIATPEDIIVLKEIAGRSVDKRDIEELRELYKQQLDEKYISQKLTRIAKMIKE